MSAVFAAPAPSREPVPSSPGSEPAQAQPALPARAQRPASPLRLIGFLSGGVGIAALWVGAGFGIDAIKKKQELTWFGNPGSAGLWVGRAF